VLQRLRAVRQNVRQDQNGFTLIELLIVIVILGILAGIVVFAVNGIVDRGTLSACKADKKTEETAVEAYFAENSKFPAADTDLVPKFLKELSSSKDYTITYHPPQVPATAADGTVTSDLAGC